MTWIVACARVPRPPPLPWLRLVVVRAKGNKIQRPVRRNDGLDAWLNSGRRAALRSQSRYPSAAYPLFPEYPILFSHTSSVVLGRPLSFI